MMMPANFSAIAESEMTYVVGGGVIEVLGSVTAPIWNAANVKKFNTNLITIVGNTYLPTVVGATLGTIFSGKYLTKYNDAEGKEKRLTVFGKDKVLWEALDPNGPEKTNGLNKFLQGVGALAAVYNLGTTDVKNAANDTLKFARF